jgi:signal transduction histidine kinase
MELAAPGARRRPGQFDGPVALTATALAAAVALASVAAAIAASAGEEPVTALGRGVIVGVPVAVGLRTLLRHGNKRFGLVLALTGVALLVSTLAESNADLAYTVGRGAGWGVEILLVYLILSYPTGRLPGSVDRALVGAAGLIVLVLFVPRLLIAQHFELPSPYTSCTQDCPANAFFLLDHQPGFVNGVVRPAGALLMVALSVAVVLRLGERMREATPLARRMFTLVFAVGMARMGLLALGFVARQANPDAWPVEVIAWGLALSAAAIACAFLASVLRWQLEAGNALERLAEWVRETPDPATLSKALGDALGDADLEIALAAPGSGQLTVPEPPVGRVVSELREHGRLVAAVVHDEALRSSPRVLDAGLAMAGVVLANQRLTAEAETATREVRRSRARIAASAERERRRIERDLHDGAQQRLVALRIELELAEDLVRRDPGQGIGRLQELEREVDEALEELRSLAHGVYPALLADRGLVEALRIVGARSSIRVELESREIRRYDPEVESAVYFCVLEALQNVLKHAEGARRVAVRLDGANRGMLRFSVRDDGVGADGELVAGAGITNMRDRLAAVGGDVRITSRRGVGTTVRASVPVASG